MNTIVTSKEEILKVSKEIIQKQGLNAINIRSVANYCGVSIGSIYNYFDSKNDLVTATVESVWQEIFHQSDDQSQFKDIISYISTLYKQMELGSIKYPNFFTLHSLGFINEDKSYGKEKMQENWNHILDIFCLILENDENINKDSFSKDFTVKKFADVLFSLMLSALLRKDFDPSNVIEIIKRTLY